jgi:hypothetical protein
MPFLYLPDAISLGLLLIVLDLLRRSAVIHLRQELLGIRNALFCYWSANQLPLSHPDYVNLLSRVESAVRLAHKLTPARLFFVTRLVRKMERQGLKGPLRAQAQELRACPNTAEARKARERLRRIDLETNMLLGVFLLMASVSGWILLMAIAVRVIFRLFSRKSGSMVDYVFDLAEKLIARLGSRALKTAIASEPV